MSIEDQPLVWFHGEIKSPPFSQAVRLEAGFLLIKLQWGEVLSMPMHDLCILLGPDVMSYGSMIEI